MTNRAVRAASVVGLVLGTLAFAGCTATEPEPDETSATAFAPVIDVVEGHEALTVTDAGGTQITLDTVYPDATVTGIDTAVADEFASAVADDALSRVDTQVQLYAEIALAECGDAAVIPATTCERTSELTIEHAGVYEDFGTVATRTNFTLGTRDRNPQVHSVTMNLKTGDVAPLTDFLDLADADDAARAAAALTADENWAMCADAGETTETYLAQAGAFSPTDEGVLLLWAPDSTAVAQCQVASILVPWEGQAGSPDADAGEAPPVAEAINGGWCPTPESDQSDGCVTITLPTATYDDGRVVTLTQLGEYAGVFSYGMEGAPFGDFYPAGVPLTLPDYYSGTDLPDVDRVWNSQTGILLIRKE